MGKLETFFKFDYKDISISSNRKLPKWLKTEVDENQLYIWGTPGKRDKGKVLIQIIGVKN